jgi:hypothetical protein
LSLRRRQKKQGKREDLWVRVRKPVSSMVKGLGLKEFPNLSGTGLETTNITF